jgi:tRNA threonylcarbamoyladenosine biosynthesis protein TsaE
LGRAFAERLKGGDIVFLSGGLGQGKTTFMQGIAKFFGNKGFARSSSFILANEYKGPNGLKLFHLDLYRLRPQETLEFGVEEYLYSGNIAVVEWPERLGENYICTWLIKFEDDCPMQRKIIIIKRGKK